MSIGTRSRILPTNSPASAGVSRCWQPAMIWPSISRAGDVPPDGPIVTDGIDTIDVTAVSTKLFSLNHSGYADTNALLSDIQLLIQTGERPPDKRIPILQRVKTVKGDY